MLFLQAGKQTIMQQPVLLKPTNSVTLCAHCKNIHSMEILQNSTGEGDPKFYHLYTNILTMYKANSAGL